MEGFVVVEAVVEADDVEHGFIGVNVEIGPELHDIDDWVWGVNGEFGVKY